MTENCVSKITDESVKVFLQNNNFDLLRFIFAFVVLLVHSHVLSGNLELSVLSYYLSSEIAVKSFFIVSGFLIFMSYERTNNIKNYFIKRVRRIYPAYVSVILGSAALGIFFTSYSWEKYFTFSLLKYLLANLLFVNFISPTLPGIFQDNPIQAVNGALWTLKVEVIFYCVVPLFVMAFSKYGRIRVLLISFILSLLYSALMSQLERNSGLGIYTELKRQLPGQLTYFIAGAAGYYFLDYFARYKIWLLGFSLSAFIIKAWLPWVIIEPLALSVLVVYLACFFPWNFNFSKYGDFSYGIYILHFPILQCLIASNRFNDSPWFLLLVTILFVLSMAFLLWHSIEKPFLKKSSHYIKK